MASGMGLEWVARSPKGRALINLILSILYHIEKKGVN